MLRIWAAGLTIVGLSSIGNASIVNVINQGNILVAGPGVGYTADFFGDSLLLAHGWDEIQNLTLSSSLDVDTTTFGTFSTTGGLTPGTIAAGTTVSSHTIYFDPVISGAAQVSYQFDGTVLGVIINDVTPFGDRFIQSDFLIPASVPGGNIPLSHFDHRGIELDGTDSMTVFAHGISLSLTAGSPGDQIRVITTGVVPEPCSLAFLGVPLLLLRKKRMLKS